MFWHMAGLSATSPVETLLDRDDFTLEELLDEDELIQECKSLNNRLINFLRGKSQVQQLLKYVIEEPPEGADNKRVFKFPFISCEIFTCEIEIIMKTLVEDEELMCLLFSFVNPDRPHGTLLAGYFSKVVICLLMRKPVAVLRYLQAHKEIVKQLVELISITSIMEVLIRLMGADETIHAVHDDSLHWLAETDLLEMLVDKLGPPNSSEAHANAADALSAVSRLSQSELAAKLSSPSFIQRLFHQALEATDSRSTLVHSLTVCISLLDPKKYVVTGMGRGQQILDSLVTINPEVIDGMLQRLGDLLKLLDVSVDETVLPTTYGKLHPPLGTNRLKIVEFLAILLQTNNEEARQELIRLDAIKLVVKLFFDYPFNNLLHHQAENIFISCFESNSKMLRDHLLQDCNFVARILEADENPYVLSTDGRPTVPASDRAPPKIGNLGHLTRLANRLIQAANSNPDIKGHLEGNSKWVEWQANVLQSRNSIENVSYWACGRPSTVRDRAGDSDDDDFKDRDYDIHTMASNLTHEVFRYGMFDNEDGDEGVGITERDEDDVFFDDESAEGVMSSLRLGEEHDRGGPKDSFLSGSNWFSQSFLAHRFEENQGTDGSSPNSSSSDDDVVVGEEEDVADTATSSDATSSEAGVLETVVSSDMVKLSVSDKLPFFNDENMNADSYLLRPLDWTSWKEPSMLEGTSGRVLFSDNNPFKDEDSSSSLVPLSEEPSECEEQVKEVDDLSVVHSPIIFDEKEIEGREASILPNSNQVECGEIQDVANAETEDATNAEIEDATNPETKDEANAKTMDATDDAETTDATDDAETKDANDDAEIKDARDDAEIKNASDDAEIKDTSDDAEINDVSDDAEINDASDDAEIKDASDDAEIKDASDDAQIKDATNAAPEVAIGEAELIHQVKNLSKNELDPRANTGDLDFNDVNYWRSDYNSSVTEVESS